MKIRKNYIEFKMGAFTSMVMGYMQILREHPEILESVEDPKMLVRLDRDNRLEMGYTEDFAIVK